jgi:hypothetical protein
MPSYSLEPSFQTSAYNPDQLVAGNYHTVTDTVILAAGQNLVRGSLIGKQAVGSASAAAVSGIHGNGTISAIAVVGVPNVPVGVYQVVFTSATAFTVVDPNGRQLADGTTGTAYADLLGFTITAGGTAFQAGDQFNITVAAGGGAYVLASASATDGSQLANNWVVLAEDTNTTSSGTNAATTCPVYLSGEFDGNYMTFGAGLTAASAKSALQSAGLSIFVKTNAIVNAIV